MSTNEVTPASQVDAMVTRQCECCGVNDMDSKRSPIWNNVMLCPYCFDEWYDNGLTKREDIKPASLAQRSTGQRLRG